MSETFEQIQEKYGLRWDATSKETIRGVIPEWALPEVVLEQYTAYENADEQLDDAELKVMQAGTAFKGARAKDEKAIRDAVIAGKPVPGAQFEVDAESALKAAFTAQRIIHGIKEQEADKLVLLLREHREQIHEAMAQRVETVLPKLQKILEQYSAALAPHYEELSEALTPVELLKSLDSRQTEGIGGSPTHVSGPSISTHVKQLDGYANLVANLSRIRTPHSIRLEDPHGHIGIHPTIGTDDASTIKCQQHIEALLKAGWKEVPWD